MTPARRLVPILVVLSQMLGATYAQISEQSKCTVSVDRSPAVRGIRLGLTADQVFALFPYSGDRPEIKSAIAAAPNAPHYGVAGLFFNTSSYLSAASDKFAGIDSISLTLFDGRVSEFRVDYAGPHSNPKGPSWSNVDEFITKLSDAFALAEAKDWRQDGEWSKTLRCNGFDVHVSTLNRTGSITIRNSVYQETVNQRAAAAESKLRREFKP